MSQNSKIAVVTGAGSGIGRASALALSRAGWTLILAGRRADQLLKTSNLCDSETTTVVTDITDPDSVAQLFNEVRNKYGRLDLLFNNAGIGAPAHPFYQLSREDWKRAIDTNLSGTFWCMQEAFKMMKNQEPMGGRIINNGSISAHVPRPNSVAYTASKHGITGLTKSASLDGRKYNICCGQIDIGNAASEMTSKIEKGILQADGTSKPEPTMNVDDVGRAVVYMAGLPLDTNVPFMTIMANEMPYIGRG